MKVFYIDISKFKKKCSKDFLLQYADREFKTEKRFYEYAIGRYLVKLVAQKYYNIADNTIVRTENGKT